jgi:hypothetical protein
MGANDAGGISEHFGSGRVMGQGALVLGPRRATASLSYHALENENRRWSTRHGDCDVRGFVQTESGVWCECDCDV